MRGFGHGRVHQVGQVPPAPLLSVFLQPRVAPASRPSLRLLCPQGSEVWFPCLPFAPGLRVGPGVVTVTRPASHPRPSPVPPCREAPGEDLRGACRPRSQTCLKGLKSEVPAGRRRRRRASVALSGSALEGGFSIPRESSHTA